MPCSSGRATAKLANVTVRATMGACVMHRRGRLSVENCLLRCDAGGLDHLFTPLVTVAAERGAKGASTKAAGHSAMPPPPASFSQVPVAAAGRSGAHPAGVPVATFGSGAARTVATAVLGVASMRRPAHAAACGADASSGILSVVETKIRVSQTHILSSQSCCTYFVSHIGLYCVLGKFAACGLYRRLTLHAGCMSASPCGNACIAHDASCTVHRAAAVPWPSGAAARARCRACASSTSARTRSTGSMLTPPHLATACSR